MATLPTNSGSRSRARSAAGSEGIPGTALAEIASTLNEALPADLVVQDVLERAARNLDAFEIAVWLDAAAGPARTWSAGGEESTLPEIAAASRVPDSGAYLLPMRFGARRVGYLAVRCGAQHSGAEPFVQTLASMLAAFVANSERSRRLEGDLETRMRELEAQKRFTEAIVDRLPLGLYVVDREYRICAWNRKRETGMQGISRDEAIGKTIFEIFKRQPMDVVRREIDEVFTTGVAQQFQTESESSGVLRTYKISKIPMRDERGRVTHVITMGEDITSWVEAREAIAQSEKLAAIGTLAAGVMHEINNPLATIGACAEAMALVAQPADDGSGAPEYLSIIETEVQRCKRIVQGLLDFSRPRAGERSLVSLNDVVERTLFLLKHHTRFKKLSVNKSLSEDIPLITGSAEQIIQVVMALLINAADAMDPGGNVTIRTRAVPHAADTVAIEVQDEGKGMGRAEIARIFEPFFTTKAPGEGTGLGLSICHGIVTEHGGKIEVTSEPGVGSRFTVTLPVRS